MSGSEEDYDADPVLCRNRMYKIIKGRSESKIFKEAVLEWEVKWMRDYGPRNTHLIACECEQRIRYAFCVQNKLNGNTIFPCGSVCIKHFNKDLHRNMQRMIREHHKDTDLADKFRQKKLQQKACKPFYKILTRIRRRRELMTRICVRRKREVMDRLKLMACEKLRNGLCLSVQDKGLHKPCSERECRGCNNLLPKREMVWTDDRFYLCPLCRYRWEDVDRMGNHIMECGSHFEMTRRAVYDMKVYSPFKLEFCREKGGQKMQEYIYYHESRDWAEHL